MGYYTKYKLSIHSSENEDERFMAEKALEDDEDLSEFYNGCADGCKWYNHESVMKGFSKNYPRVVFELSGEGEESDDIWKKFFQNGKIQTEYAVISYGEFNKKKLK